MKRFLLNLALSALAVVSTLPAAHSMKMLAHRSTEPSALIQAIQRGSLTSYQRILKSLSDRGQKPSMMVDARGTPLILSLASLTNPNSDRASVYEQMIEFMLKLDAKSALAEDRAYIGDGRTVLHEAAALGNLKLITILLKAGADVNAKDANGESALHFAARFGKLEAAEFLVSSGARIDLQSRFTRITPLMAAAEMGQTEVIQFLMKAGAKKDEKDVFGKTAPERFREYQLADQKIGVKTPTREQRLNPL